MSWKVYQEDSGTGLDDQTQADFLDGASATALAHVPNATDFAPTPPTLTVDYAVPEVTLGQAQYRISAANVSTRQRDGTQITWPETTFAVHAPETTLGLAADATNAVFVDVDLAAGPDSAQYVVNQSGSAPSSTALRVATIDTAAETATVENAQPDGEFGEVTTNGATINASLTDPSGTKHTGEIADDGDTQPPEAHGNAAHSEAYTTTDENVENFATAGSGGEVPIAQPDGTLSMGAVGGFIVEDITNFSVVTSSDYTNSLTAIDVSTSGTLVAIDLNGTAAFDSIWDITLTVDGNSRTYTAAHSNNEIAATVPSVSFNNNLKIVIEPDGGNTETISSMVVYK
jgi:hypothetical protein